MNKHPERTELLKAVTKMTAPIKSHLDTCAACRELYELFQTYRVAGQLHLPEPPDAWVAKAVNLMHSDAKLQSVKKLLARLTFDSWAALPASAVRSVAVQQERRMHFEVDAITFDLRAERSGKQWHFTAQITAADNADTAEFTIEIGRKNVDVNEIGLYQWQSSTLPKQIVLKSASSIIELPALLWK